MNEEFEHVASQHTPIQSKQGGVLQTFYRGMGFRSAQTGTRTQLSIRFTLLPPIHDCSQHDYILTFKHYNLSFIRDSRIEYHIF